MSPESDTAAVAPFKCDACNRPMESPLFCGGCHTLHSADGRNYFELFGLEPRHDLDPDLLRRSYLALARTLHPDRFAGADPDGLQQSMRLSAQLNRAYFVLSDPILRAEYVLELAGGPSAAEDRSVPAEVLAQALAVREELDEARATGDADALARIRAEVRERLAVALTDVTALVGELPGDEALRGRLRAELNAIKYHQKMLEQL